MNRRAEYNAVMCYMLRKVEVLEHLLAAGVTAEDFNQVQLHSYMLIVYVLQFFFDKYKRLPTQLEFVPLLERAAAALITSNEAVQQAMRLASHAYSLPEADLDAAVVLEHGGMLQRVIDDVKVAPLERQLSNELDHKRRESLREHIARVHAATRIANDVASSVFNPDSIQEMLDAQRLIQSGIDFIDLSLGGLVLPSAMGLIAESSGGKTMFGVQLLVETANRGGKSIGFFYEQPVHGDIAKRLYSYAACLDRSQVDKRFDELDTAALQAIKASVQRLQSSCMIYDMSGTQRSTGLGGPREIDTIIGGLIRRGAFKPNLVVIDWLGPMVTRYHTVNPTKLSRKEQLDAALIELVDISRRYDLSILILHQIAPHIMEGKTPAFVPEYTHAHECKSFGILLDYVFTFGRACHETGCMWFNVSKARGRPKVKRIVRMDGATNRIIDANEEWALMASPVNDRFFSKRGARNIEGDTGDW